MRKFRKASIDSAWIRSAVAMTVANCMFTRGAHPKAYQAHQSVPPSVILGRSCALIPQSADFHWSVFVSNGCKEVETVYHHLPQYHGRMCIRKKEGRKTVYISLPTFPSFQPAPLSNAYLSPQFHMLFPITRIICKFVFYGDCLCNISPLHFFLLLDLW